MKRGLAKSGLTDEARPYLVGSLAVIVAFIVSFALIPAFSPTNDDAYIEQTLAGTGGVSAEPTPYTTTINYVLGLAVSSLYRVLPAIRWWILLQLLLVFLALFVFGWTVIYIADRRGLAPRLQGPKRALVELTILLLAESGIGLTLIPRLQFTTTASLLISVAIFATCAWGEDDGAVRGELLFRFILPVVLAVFCFAYRAQSGLIGFLLWLIAASGRIAGSSQNGLLGKLRGGVAYWAPIAVAAALAVVLTGANAVASILPGQPETDAYAGFSTLVDYPRPSFDEDPDLYESAGWDRELSELVGSWFMLDERVNSDSLGKINQMNEGYILSGVLNDPIGTVSYHLRDFVHPVSLAYFSLFVSLVVLLAVSARRGSGRPFVWLAIAIPLVLLGYLAVRGRLIERATLSVLLPATACLASLLPNGGLGRVRGRLSSGVSVAVLIAVTLVMAPLMMLTNSNLARAFCCIPSAIALIMLMMSILEGRTGRGRRCLSYGMLTIALTGCCALTAISPAIAAVRMYGWGSSSYAQNAQQLKNTHAMFDYFSQHDEMLYIYSGVPMTLQYLWLDEWPENHTGWGGWRYSYTWFADAMREQGLGGHPTSDDLLRENVRFVSASEERCNLLLRYMRNRYGSSVAMQQVDSITDEIKVYRFVLGTS